MTPEMNGSKAPAPWALAILNDLSAEEIETLKDIGQLGSQKRKNAGFTIQRIVEKVRHETKEPKAAKRGPKKRESVNQTERDVSALYEALRMILGLPFDTSVPDVLAKLDFSLTRAQLYFSDNLLLKKDEAVRVESLTEKWFSLYEKEETTLDNLRELSGEIGIVSSSDNPTQWAEGMKIQPKQKERAEAGPTPAQRRSILLEQVATTLKLYRNVEAKQALKVSQESRHGKTPTRSVLAAAELSKKDVLWAALGRLFHITSCLNETGFSWKPKERPKAKKDALPASISFGEEMSADFNSGAE